MSLSAEAQQIESTGSRSRVAEGAQFSATDNTHRGKGKFHPEITLKHNKPVTQRRAERERELQIRRRISSRGHFTRKSHTIPGDATSMISKLSSFKLIVSGCWSIFFHQTNISHSVVTLRQKKSTHICICTKTPGVTQTCICICVLRAHAWVHTCTHTQSWRQKIQYFYCIRKQCSVNLAHSDIIAVP